MQLRATQGNKQADATMTQTNATNQHPAYPRPTSFAKGFGITTASSELPDPFKSHKSPCYSQSPFEPKPQLLSPNLLATNFYWLVIFEHLGAKGNLFGAETLLQIIIRPVHPRLLGLEQKSYLSTLSAGNPGAGCCQPIEMEIVAAEHEIQIQTHTNTNQNTQIQIQKHTNKPGAGCCQPPLKWK